MLTKAFLSPTEIKERIAQEAASDKERKLNLSRLKPFTVMVAIFLCQLRLDQEKPLLWLSVSLI